MEKKDGMIVMTREQFKHYCSDALHFMMSDDGEHSAMSSFIIGSTSMIAYAKLEDIIFGKEEPETDHDTETSIF